MPRVVEIIVVYTQNWAGALPSIWIRVIGQEVERIPIRLRTPAAATRMPQAELGVCANRSRYGGRVGHRRAGVRHLVVASADAD
jgi:hypothetical protein